MKRPPVCAWLQCSISAYCSLLLAPAPGIADVSPRLTAGAAVGVFREANQICEADGGRLWGIPLYGPTLLVDPHTRAMMANEGTSGGELRPDDGVFVGELPATVNIANTATDWAGKRWTMIQWPLPDDRAARRTLIAHELWHRVQDQLGLPASNPGNAHLDTRDGRFWLRLEMRALAAALAAAPASAARRAAASDALLFRRTRQRRFGQDSASQEAALEMNEGLAEYTGLHLSGRTEEQMSSAAAQSLRDAESNPTMVRSFAYATGPAYGLLLDDAAPGWRRNARAGRELASLLQSFGRVTAPSDPSSADAAAQHRYDGAALAKSEDERERQRVQRHAEYRRRFVDGPVLRLAFEKMNVQFDPAGLEPLEGVGTFYPTMRITDNWGVLQVTGGGVIASDWSAAIVPAPVDAGERLVRGEGWRLELAEGWTVARAARKGGGADFALRKQ